MGRRILYKHHQYIWFLIEFTNGDKEWYCVSRVLRKALFAEKRNNRFWKNTMIGNYITVSTTEYRNNRSRLTVGKITKINISSRSAKKYNWTRNQFVTPDHLLNFRDSYNYLRHDYSWYNRFAIWIALKYWHNELKISDIRTKKKKLRQLNWQINHTNYKFKKMSRNKK